MKIVIIIYVLLAFLYSASTQQIMNSRNFDVVEAQKSNIWYDSTTSTFQTQYPIISNLPPLNSGMPFEILYSYIIIDSLLKYTGQKHITDLFKQWNSLNDTLNNTAKYYYMIKDYNPVVFTQYSFSIRDYQKYPKNLITKRKKDLTTGEYIDTLTNLSVDSIEYSGVYTNDIFSLEYLLWNKYNDFIPQSELWTVLTLLESDYILRIRVLDVDSIEAKNSTVSDLVYGVHAEVLDTLKGQYFRNECDIQLLNNKINIGLSTNSTLPCIKFMYKKEIYDPDYKRVDWINDPAFETGYNSFGLTEGQEAIVFLKFNMRKIDNENDYLRLLVHKYASNGALPIINGQVRDLNHFWSPNDLVNYQLWKNIFDNIKGNIINLNY